MTFFCDHDVPAEVARVLQQEGHAVTELREALPIDASDADVLRFTRSHGLLLVTCNRNDFLALARQHGAPGLIVLIRRHTRQAECAHLLALIDLSRRRRPAREYQFCVRDSSDPS